MENRIIYVETVETILDEAFLLKKLNERVRNEPTPLYDEVSAGYILEWKEDPSWQEWYLSTPIKKKPSIVSITARSSGVGSAPENH